MKYKLVGWADMITGGVGGLQQLAMIAVVYPKMVRLYGELGASLPWYGRVMPYVSMGAVIYLGGLTVLGAKLVFDKSPKEGWWLAGLAGLAIAVGAAGLLMTVSVMGTVAPIYKLGTGI